MSRPSIRPEVGEDAREWLIDCGEAAPALLAVFERTDAMDMVGDDRSPLYFLRPSGRIFPLVICAPLSTGPLHLASGWELPFWADEVTRVPLG